VSPIVGDDNVGPRGPRHLRDVRVVDAPAGGSVLCRRFDETCPIRRRKIVNRHPVQDLLLEQAGGV